MTKNCGDLLNTSMSEHIDYRSEIDMWADIWNDMQSQNVIPQDEPRPKPQMSDFAAHMLGDNTPRDTYYDYLDASDELFAEEKTPNPVYPDSVGVDQEGPKPVWVKEDFLDEIQKLKDKLFKVENQAAKMGQGKTFSESPVNDDGKKLMGEIDSIRKQIERVSSQLGIKEEPSPWQVKK